MTNPFIFTDSAFAVPADTGLGESALCSSLGCDNLVSAARRNLGYGLCLACGEKIAKQRAQQHCIVPMHKSNYVLVTAEAAPELLRGINNKSVR